MNNSNNSKKRKLIEALAECLQMLQWRVPEEEHHEPDVFWRFVRPLDVDLFFLKGSNGYFAHEVRRSLRWLATTKVSNRADMAGLSGKHVNMSSTTFLYRGKVPRSIRCHLGDLNQHVPLTALCRGTLSSVLTGSTRTADRLTAAKLIDSSCCPACQLAPETPEHMACACPAWDCVRATYPFAMPASFPACSKVCGIDLECEWMLQQRQELEQIPPFPSEPAHPFAAGVTVYTDGACSNQGDIYLRRAGVGVYFGMGHPCNFSGPLPGLEQSSVRAEVAAVALVLTWASSAVTIWSDNSYCVTTFDTLLQNPCFDVSTLEHNDLWQPIHVALHSRCSGSAIRKIDAHKQPLPEGTDEYRHWHGNFCADKLAVEGASMHSLTDAHISEYYQRLRYTVSKQLAMVRIVDERWRFLKNSGLYAYREDGDAGDSQPGEHGSVVQQNPCPSFPRIDVGSLNANKVFDVPGVSQESLLTATSTKWKYQPVLLPALLTYFTALPWDMETRCSVLEVLVDFICFTGVIPTYSTTEDPDVSVAIQAFISAIRTTCSLMSCEISPSTNAVRLSDLTVFGLPRQALTFTGCPSFRSADAVQTFMEHCYNNVAAGSKLKFKWPFTLKQVPDSWKIAFSTPGNEVRKVLQRSPCIKTHVADVKRQTRIDLHNSNAAARGKHVLVIDVPDHDMYGGETEPSRIWPRLGKLRCTACGCIERISKITTFTNQICSG